MKPFFIDEGLQTQFEQDGFVVIPFLEENKVLSLLQLAECHLERSPQTFFSTTFYDNNSEKESIHKEIAKVFEKPVSKVLENIQPLGCSFLIKKPGEQAILPPHQDWTVVDESQSASCTIWVSLIDSTAENGAIRVLPGSHKVFPELRGPSIPVSYQEHYDYLESKMQTLEMKAGEAFIFNQALIHSSGSNRTDNARISATFGFVPVDDQLVFHHFDGEKLSSYDVHPDFFQTYTQIGQRPVEAQLKKTKTYHPEKLNKLELISRLRSITTMKELFSDPQLQNSFNKNGFVKVPALDEAQVAELKSYYESLGIKDEMGYGFHISLDQTDKGMVREVIDKVFSVALPKLEPVFKDAKAFTCSFVIKEPNPKGVVPTHQDWTFVEDESEHCSVTCWIPLVDVNMDNGALGVIKGSHKLSDYRRPSPSPEVPNPLQEHLFSIFPYMQIVDMKAGEALIFDNRTFHASPPNTTDQTRLAVGLGFTQREARLVHYYLKPNGKQDTVIRYNVDEEFFKKHDNLSLSKLHQSGGVIEDYPAVGEEPYDFPKYDSEELLKVIKENGNEMNVPLVEKLAKLFNYNPDGSSKEEQSNNQQEAEDSQKETSEEKLPFWKVYTPLNILREIKYRITGR